jgi:hypothetical protein
MKYILKDKIKKLLFYTTWKTWKKKKYLIKVQVIQVYSSYFKIVVCYKISINYFY